MASRFTTFSSGWPSSSFLMGSSCFLPVRVRGTSATCTISSGTKRGESAVRMAAAMRSRSASSSAAPSRSATKSGMWLSRPRYSRSTTRLSSTSGKASTARYSSLVPMRRPWRLMVASLRP